MFTESVSVYRFSGLGPFDAGVFGAAVLPAGFVAAPAGAGADGMLPNANERLIPRLTEKKLGPMP